MRSLNPLLVPLHYNALGIPTSSRSGARPSTTAMTVLFVSVQNGTKITCSKLSLTQRTPR